MFCHSCGAKVRDGAQFCPACGSKLRTPADSGAMGRDDASRAGNRQTAPSVAEKTSNEPVKTNAAHARSSIAEVRKSQTPSDKVLAAASLAIAVLPIFPQISILQLGQLSVIDLLKALGTISSSSGYTGLLGSSYEVAVASLSLAIVLYFTVWLGALVVTGSSCLTVWKSNDSCKLAPIIMDTIVSLVPLCIAAFVNSSISSSLGTSSLFGSVSLISVTWLVWVELIASVALIALFYLKSHKSSSAQ